VYQLRSQGKGVGCAARYLGRKRQLQNSTLSCLPSYVTCHTHYGPDDRHPVTAAMGQAVPVPHSHMSLAIGCTSFDPSIRLMLTALPGQMEAGR
jgi:hypothetical protein